MEIHLTKKDFNIDWFSGTGAGGQHRNKHQNCCRITHIESGIFAIGTGKERTMNLRTAFTTLADRVIRWLQSKNINTIPNINRSVIRNYNESRNEVHDKISGLKMPYKSIVVGNNITPMLEARRGVMNKSVNVETDETNPARG
ncbi:MAG: peptide chain release factor-like protein [Patescibacteria group bacterium]|nr:peptide chain release factor-like protein [Patescibacteria group bacterium]